MQNLKFIKFIGLFFIIITAGLSINCAINFVTQQTSLKDQHDIVNKKAATQIPELKTIVEKTFAIIKPDAVRAKNSGEIIKLIELNNFNIVSLKKIQLTKKQAEEFYGLMKNKPFFKDLVNYMTSGPIIAMILEKENAIQDWRDLMGATNPEKANIGTIRKMFGSSIQANAVHGSDSKENAVKEIDFFFKKIN